MAFRAPTTRVSKSSDVSDFGMTCWLRPELTLPVSLLSTLSNPLTTDDLGQKYVAHHDYGLEDKSKVCGPRILTFFLYLSDVDEGGETSFPLLNISVTPRKGKALLWPSTLDEDPSSIDRRTTHEARPVLRGRKFAANSWIHLHDFMKPNLWGCTGTFDEL